MQQQNRLRKYRRFRTHGSFGPMLLTAIMLVLFASSALSPKLAVAADNSDSLDQAAQAAAFRKKADEYLATAAAHSKSELFTDRSGLRSDGRTNLVRDEDITMFRMAGVAIVVALCAVRQDFGVPRIQWTLFRRTL